MPIGTGKKAKAVVAAKKEQARHMAGMHRHWEKQSPVPVQ